jgi:hypothetical protein
MKKASLLTVDELDKVFSLGYTIHVKWISPVEGYEYRVSKIGDTPDEHILAYRKSARAAFNFIVRNSV